MADKLGPFQSTAVSAQMVPWVLLREERLIKKARCFCDSCEGKGDVCSDVTDKETALGVLESDRHGGGSSASHSYGSSLQALC